MKKLVLFLVIFPLLFTSCSYTTFYRPLKIEDIIIMTKENISPDTIINQIKATNSRYRLTTDDILMLKQQGVADDVIEYMIETDYVPERFSWEYDYYRYPYYYPYYYNYYDWYGPYYRPYGVYRQPGLIGRFYNYYPLYNMEHYYRDTRLGRLGTQREVTPEIRRPNSERRIENLDERTPRSERQEDKQETPEKRRTTNPSAPDLEERKQR